MVTYQQIIEAYGRTFGVKWYETLIPWFGPDFKLADQNYEDLDLDKVQRVIQSDHINEMVYKAEDFDCDDFAFGLMGAFHHEYDTASMPIFICWVQTPEGGHAVCSCLAHDRTDGELVPLIIEPQNDAIYMVPKEWKLMLLCG